LCLHGILSFIHTCRRISIIEVAYRFPAEKRNRGKRSCRIQNSMLVIELIYICNQVVASVPLYSPAPKLQTYLPHNLQITNSHNSRACG
jgi:hypothetical protein